MRHWKKTTTLAALLILTQISLAAETFNEFKEFLQAGSSCKTDGQLCVENDGCCNNCCKVGICSPTALCEQCTPVATPINLVECGGDGDLSCCTGLCCMNNYCRSTKSCALKCVESNENSYCDSNKQCCDGCCTIDNICVDASTGCLTELYGETWFIIVFYVLLPLFFVTACIFIGIYCYKKSERKRKFNEAQREYLERTNLLKS